MSAEASSIYSTKEIIGPYPLLQIKDLHASYTDSDGKELKVLNGISVNFPSKGEITAILGANGSGKSTFIRCLNRLHEAIPRAKASGQVLLEGDDIYRYKSNNLSIVRSHIGMVFQQPNPFPHLSIYDNVLRGYRLKYGEPNKEEADELVENLLQQVGLWDEVHPKMRKTSGAAISGGQQQRLCIARALAINPSILLLDEPCSALDVIATEKINQLLLDLRDRCKIIIVSHNIQQVFRVSDEIIFIDKGQIVERGVTKDIAVKPKSEQLENYLRMEATDQMRNSLN